MSKPFEQRITFKPLSPNNTPAKVVCKELFTALETDLLIKGVEMSQLGDAKEMYDFLLTWKDGSPIELAVEGTNLKIELNRMGKVPRPEFKLNIESNGEALYLFQVLGNFVLDYIKSEYGVDGVVKSPVYKNVLQMPWNHSYGKELDIEVRSPGAQFICNGEKNGAALERLIGIYPQAVVRFVLKPWMMREKVTGIIKVGYKPHVQQVEFK